MPSQSIMLRFAHPLFAFLGLVPFLFMGGIDACSSSGVSSPSSSSTTVFKLPELDYEQNGLEPYISEETISYHYGAHHQTYVDNLNAFVEADSSLAGLTLVELMTTTDGSVFNNAAQVYNHNFYWKSLSPDGGGKPSGKLYDAIISSYGTYDNFVDVFDTAASGHFGSGWAWLVKNDDGSVEVVDTHDASNPVVEGTGTPLLTCDVWEHAYYIDYRNVRADYIESWWSVVNWKFAEKKYEEDCY